MNNKLFFDCLAPECGRKFATKAKLDEHIRLRHPKKEIKEDKNKSTIITTNQSFTTWGEVFGDTTIASAIIDRLVHHSVIINIKGKSYRIKDLIQEDFDNQKVAN